MNIDILPVDLQDPVRFERSYGLFAKAYPQLPLSMDSVRRDLAAEFFDTEALYLGAWHKDQLVAFNGFLPHHLRYGDTRVLVYQSVYSATLPEFGGRGLFSRIQEEARLQLRARGAQLIVGYPNSRSFPIFTQKLGFQHISHHLVCKLRTVFRDRVVPPTDGAPLSPVLTLPHDQILAWKRLKYPSQLVDRHGDNRVWGVAKQYRKWGLTANYLAVGGVRIEAPAALEADLNATAQKANLPWLRLEMLPHSPLARMIAPRRLKAVPTPFIWLPLTDDHPWQAQHFGFLEGMKDAF